MIVEVILDEDVMTNSEIKEAMSKYKAELEKLNAAITELQDSCKHKEMKIKSISTSVMNLRKICKNCGKEIGYPSPQDLKNEGYC